MFENETRQILLCEFSTWERNILFLCKEQNMIFNKKSSNYLFINMTCSKYYNYKTFYGNMNGVRLIVEGFDKTRTRLCRRLFHSQLGFYIP